MELRGGRRGAFPKEALLCCALLYLFFVYALSVSPTWRGSVRLDSGRVRTDSSAQNSNPKSETVESGEGPDNPSLTCAASTSERQVAVTRGRRRQDLTSSSDGPGSYPPRCTAKCGDCTPCVPVHVAVPPGVPVPAEYYPEAWRCKCGNKLYMP